MPEDVLITVVTKSEDDDEMRGHLQDVLGLSFVASGPHGV
jgi:hypothetical protein